MNIGFIGAGGIAHAHLYALEAMKFYYSNVPAVSLTAVTSAREESRQSFAGRYGFSRAVTLDEFTGSGDLDAVYILGPNKVHFPHLEAVLQMPGVKRIYLEKPICAGYEEEQKTEALLSHLPSDKRIQVGFQFLFASPIIKALQLWQSGDFGAPIHFSFTLKHSDYLDKSYRDKRRSRLTPAPDGGAMADLGSHAVSLLVAFLGEDVEITGALQGGNFPDVPQASDLYSEISLLDKRTGAVGNLSASRVSAGIGDQMAFEIYAQNGALRYNSERPDRYDYFLQERGEWSTVFTGSDYQPFTSFPSKHVPGGWLRPLIHAHYLFLSGADTSGVMPDLQHGLAVQRLVRETAEYLERFREMRESKD